MTTRDTAHRGWYKFMSRYATAPALIIGAAVGWHWALIVFAALFLAADYAQYRADFNQQPRWK